MMLRQPIPGRIFLAPGKFNDFKTLERFHYRPRRPRTIADVVAAWHQLPHVPPRCIGVGVLSWPTACQATRHKVLLLNDLSYGEKLRFANVNIRTISRVVVHPTFRSLGVSTAIVRALIARCPTRYIESAAMMAHASPLFARAGMRRFDPAEPDKPVYFLFDKWLDRLPWSERVIPGIPPPPGTPGRGQREGEARGVAVGQTFLSVTAFHAAQ